MKTQFLTLITLVALVISTSNTAFATTHTEDKNAIVLTEAANFSKIEVRGNVEVFISDGVTDQVKVYNKYYSESAMVQNRNGVLRIASYKNEKLVVWITVSDLRSLTAYDNAEIKTFGKLSAINLDLNLYNNATAKLDVNMFTANININDRAKADIKGDVQECYLTHDRSATVNSTALKTGKMILNNIAYIAPKAQELAGI
ncbi:GIN domain-containing protein [Mucilaginibacter terrae]|uniref:GIN domain-containing protein n=1 Tax=Mucilaginibacter terrae TaxID=1955052 RepID=UPI00364488DE